MHTCIFWMIDLKVGYDILYIYLKHSLILHISFSDICIGMNSLVQNPLLPSGTDNIIV